jgi:hypothetical protein
MVTISEDFVHARRCAYDYWMWLQGSQVVPCNIFPKVAIFSKIHSKTRLIYNACVQLQDIWGLIYI